MANLKEDYRRMYLLIDQLKADHRRRCEEVSATQDQAYWQGQPHDGKGLWICSLQNEFRSTTAGSLCLALLPLAALKIVEGSHRVASIEEIKAHLEAQAERGRELEAMERRARLSRQAEGLNAQ